MALHPGAPEEREEFLWCNRLVGPSAYPRAADYVAGPRHRPAGHAGSPILNEALTISD